MPKRSPFSRLSEHQAVRMLKALDRAVEHCGGWGGLATTLAEHTGESISAQAVFRWAVKGVPAERAVELEHATNGLVLRQELRPDLYDGMLSED